MFDKLGCQRFLGMGVAFSAVLATAAECDNTDDMFTNEEWGRIHEMSMNPTVNPSLGVMPTNPINKLTNEQEVGTDRYQKCIKLGQSVFFETDYAEAISVDNNPNGKKGEVGKAGCANCH